jgi:rhodanese-related sulfurtransferase
MSFFDFFKMPDINEGVEKYKNTDNAVLIDVRTKEEYEE